MAGFEFLDLVIGLVFIYFILGIVVSVVQELRANIFMLRAKNLEKWFEDTLEKGNLGKKLLDHKLIAGLVKKRRKPSYIPSEHFVAALLDTITEGKPDNSPYTIDSLEIAVKDSDLLPEDIKGYILQSISEASADLNQVRSDIAHWFDNCMDRVSGTYKNIQQKFLIIISIVVAGLFNADTITISKYLYSDEDARLSLAESAVSFSQDTVMQSLTKKYITLNELNRQDTADTVYINTLKNIKASLDDLQRINKSMTDFNLPLGWSAEEDSVNTFPNSFIEWFMKIIGILITGFGVSLGAPFWFDLLNKLANLRGAGRKPQPST